ncbi:MAG: ABC transporter permease [bacterium]
MSKKSFENFILIASIFVFSIYTLLFISLFSIFRWELKDELPRIVLAIKNSLLASIISTFLSVIIGIPCAYFLSRYKTKFSRIIDIILEFPLIISPAALGATIVIFLNTPIGKPLKNFILFTFNGIILAQFLTVLGLFIRVLKSAIDEINYKYELVANLFGANKFQIFFDIVLPLVKRALFAGIALSLAKSFGEFGATLMVAGSIPYKTETLPIYLYHQLSTANINQAILSILIILATGILTIYFVRVYAKNP